MIKNRVLIVTSEFPPQPGGIANHAYNLALALNSNAYEVTVIADQRSCNGLEEKIFDKTLPYNTIRIPITQPRFLMYFKRIYKVLRNTKASEHVIATGKFSLWSVAFCSLFLSRHFICVVHGTEVNYKNRWLKSLVNWSLSKFESVIAVSNYTKSLITYLGLNIKVIPNGINFDKWENRIRRNMLLKGDPKLITVGNVSSRKGQQNVIAHLPFLINAYPEIHYHCIGLKTEVDDFLQLANNLKVQNHVTFHGRKSDAELKAMLNDADIFIMLSSETSTGDVEGFGIAILEANAMGVPAIGALDCGIEDAINQNKSGMLVPAKDAEALLAAIRTLQNDNVNFQNGAIDWAKKHDWSKVVSLYKEVLQ